MTDQSSMSMLLGRLNDLEELMANHQKAITAYSQLRERDAEGIARIARVAGEGHMTAKVLREMVKAERGSKFDEQWEAAYAAAFPPPPQQNQAEIELAIATIREENQQQVAALRDQFERAMNQLMRSVHQQSQDQQKNIVPMRLEPEQPEPSPSPKPKAKPKKTKPQTTETREGVGVDRDEPV